MGSLDEEPQAFSSLNFPTDILQYMNAFFCVLCVYVCECVWLCKLMGVFLAYQTGYRPHIYLNAYWTQIDH